MRFENFMDFILYHCSYRIRTSIPGISSVSPATYTFVSPERQYISVVPVFQVINFPSRSRIL